MNNDSLDARGHDAARAGRAAVQRVEDKVLGAVAEGSWDPRARFDHRRSRALVGALVIVALLLTAAVAVIANDRSGKGARVATGPAGQDGVPGGQPVRDSAFCQRAPKPGAEMPASYVGSPQHVADIAALVAVAPPALREDLIRFHAYVKANVNPARPDSQLTENWPPEMRSVVERILRFIQDNCGSAGAEGARPRAADAGPCVRRGDAEVCGRRNGSSVSIETSGLQPGSTLEIGPEGAGEPMRVPIGAEGRPTGQIGSVGVSFPTHVQVVATIRGGETLSGTLTVT